MSQGSYTDSDEYSDNEYSSTELGSSGDISDLSTSTGDMPELFNVKTGPPQGDYDGIEILVGQLKTLNAFKVTEDYKIMIYKNIAVRAEAESIETEPWITSFFSVVEYPSIRPILQPKLQNTIDKLPAHEKESIIISSRFTNVPEEVVFEMYEVFTSVLKKAAESGSDTPMILLSLEEPVVREEAEEIRKVFPDFVFPKGSKLFPKHTEDVFLILNKVEALFTCNIANDKVVKGYRIGVDMLEKFVACMKEYYA